MVSKQVRYSVGTRTGEQENCRHQWTFLIIDTPREIVEKKERIYLQLSPIIEFKDLYRGAINADLSYSFFSFFGSQGRLENPGLISKTLRVDSKLFVQNDVSLERYLQTVIKGRM
jgi:hypothetical protein